MNMSLYNIDDIVTEFLALADDIHILDASLVVVHMLVDVVDVGFF